MAFLHIALVNLPEQGVTFLQSAPKSFIEGIQVLCYKVNHD
jgi:hypothetical protein